MAHVDTGNGRGGKRKLDAALNLVPYIDLLVTLMTFLMITAAWASYSALTANAASGGGGADAPAKEPLVIDVLEREVRGLDAIATAPKDTPIQVRVEDGVHHGKVIEILDAISEQKLPPPTVQPLGT
jgi:biopolymer transport protein ExbD